MIPWNAPKAKVQLRLSVQRLRTLQQKKEAHAKASRRDIANLLERGKIETARIKVESLINEDIHVELLELLELYCELLLARFGLLDQNNRAPDPAVQEGVCSIIYAAPRTEVKGIYDLAWAPVILASPVELGVLRDLLMHKYGREFSLGVMENRDNCVTDRVMRKLVVDTPSTELVDAYLRELAKGYGLPWGSDTAEDVASGSDEVQEPKASEADEQPNAVTEDALPSPPVYKKVEEENDFDALTKRFAALKKR